MRVREIDELRRPHLVLAHAGHPDRLRIRGMRQLLDHPLRSKRAVGRLLVGERVFLDPRVDKPPPCGQIRLAVNGVLAFDARHERAQHRLHIADDRHVGSAVLADLGRVDVDVDDLRMGRELGELARHAVGETRARRDDQVGLGHS